MLRNRSYLIEAKKQHWITMNGGHVLVDGDRGKAPKEKKKSWRHRELPHGPDVSVKLHRGTMDTLKEELAKIVGGPIKKIYQAAIKAHELAMKTFEELGDEPEPNVKKIRIAKKIAKAAHILTRRIPG